MSMELVLAILFGYLLGSIPFALVIGKVFFKKDIRNYGSGNLGGGNAGRVLGKKAGLSVMTLDILKVSFAIGLCSLMEQRETAMIAAGLAAAIGHCFPLFARFKGGKAVATMYGFLFGMAVFGPYGLEIFFIPLITFLIVLYLCKIIAAASIGSGFAITAYIFFATEDRVMFGALVIFTILMIVRHRKNIERILKHEENKISWM